MGYRYKEMPKLIAPVRPIGERPIEIEGTPMTVDKMSGVFYTFDVYEMGRLLSDIHVEFVISGNPYRGIKLLEGKGFRIYDVRKAWLFNPDDEETKVIDRLENYSEILGNKMSFTAAQSFVRLFGEGKWLREDIMEMGYEAYIGGMQWCKPGIYDFNVSTYDIRKAYYWAMHENELPDKWNLVDSDASSWFERRIHKLPHLSMIKARVKLNGKNVIPILPTNSRKIVDGLFGMRARYCMPGECHHEWEGIWYAEEILASLDYIEEIKIESMAVASPTSLSRRFVLPELGDELLKKLSVTGYGINCQPQDIWRGYIGGIYKVASAFGKKKIKSVVQNGLPVWWVKHLGEKRYVRIDWGGITTARIRARLVSDTKGISPIRVFVDSVTAEGDLVTGEEYGDYKLEHFAKFAIMINPGLCVLGDRMKRSGMHENLANEVIDKFLIDAKNGIRPNRHDMTDLNFEEWHNDGE